MFSQLNKAVFGTAATTSPFGFGNTSVSVQKPFSKFGTFATSGFGPAPQPSFGVPVQNKPFVSLFDQQNSGQQTNNFGFGNQSSLFGQPTSSLGAFGITSAQTGMDVKYKPTPDMDNIQQNGIPTSIKIKLCSITCMKEYENKSFEELRSEHYQSDRKSPQNSPATTVLYGQGQSQLKPTFGFGATQQNQLGLFGKSNSTTTAKPFSSTIATQNMFTPTTSAAPLFGFGQSDKQNTSGLFGKFPPSAQPPLFPFTPHTTTASSFDTSKFKIGGDLSTSKTSFPPTFNLPAQTTASQTFQYGFGPTTQSKPAFNFNTQSSTTPVPQQQQFVLKTGEEFDSQLQEFRNSVQQIFQPFPRREFLKSPKQIVTIPPVTPKMHPEVIDKAPTNVSKLRVIASINRSRYALVNEIKEIPPEYIKLSGRRLVLGRKSKEMINKRQPSDSSDKPLLDRHPGFNMKVSGKCIPLLAELKASRGTQTTELEKTKSDEENSSDADNEILNEPNDDNPSANPCGDFKQAAPYVLKLERPEYYMIPPRNELHKYVNNSGECIINGFIVGRAGYGQIYFPGEIDVSNLNLDEIVHFGYRELTVYPDNDSKPPIGEGLNRPAQVTLDQIWPLDRDNHSNRMLKNPEEIERVHFTERLALLSERQDTKFLEYRSETGSWVFSVEHFSKFRFSDDELDEQMPEANEDAQQLPYTDSKNIVIMKASFFTAVENKPSNKFTCDVPESFAARRNKIRTHFPKHFVCRNRNRETPNLSTLTSKNYTDLALFKSRSFRVGWRRNHGFICRSDATRHLSCLQINKHTIKLDEHMKVALRTSQITTEDSEAPLCTVKEGFEVLTRHQSLSEGTVKELWDLCLAFWGPNANTPRARRELFSKWLQETVEPCLQAELKLNSLRNICTYLTGHQLDKAAELAMKYNLPHLAVLIAQAGSQESVRMLVYEQVQQWKNSGSTDLINRDILKVYMLLAGVPVLNDVNVCDDLDWRRALAVHFWYMCPAGASIINGVKAYQSGCSLDYACSPTGTYDILYEIIRFYLHESSLTKPLNPIEPLDYHLSWLLLQVATALKFGQILPKFVDFIHVNFASQLENMGLWKWAVFVLLFIKDRSVKTNLIMNVFDRNLTLSSCKFDVDSLVNDFKIPRTWIHKVLAQKSAFFKKPIEGFMHLIYSNEWNKAHSVALLELVPRLMLNQQYDELMALLENLTPQTDQIYNWRTGIGLILDILNLHMRIFNRNRHHNATNIKQTRSSLTLLCYRMKYLPVNLPEQIWVVSELSELILILLRIFSSTQTCINSDMQMLVACIRMLLMPPDYKLRQLRCIIQYLID